MSTLVEALRAPGSLVTVELRPPRSDLSGEAGMSAWIDLHPADRNLPQIAPALLSLITSGSGLIQRLIDAAEHI